MIDAKKVSLSNQVFEKLEEAVLNGYYPQGSIISAEKAASDFRVGTATAKEALIRLESERLAETVQSGFKVLGITEKDINDIFNVKRHLETQAAALAAEKMSQEEINDLTEILEKQEKAVEEGDSEKVRNLDTKFHDKIYEGCGSTTFELILSPVHHKLSKYRKASLDNRERILNSVKEHREILEAISSKNSAEAEKTMLKHIDNSYSSIAKIKDRK